MNIQVYDNDVQWRIKIFTLLASNFLVNTVVFAFSICSDAYSVYDLTYTFGLTAPVVSKVILSGYEDLIIPGKQTLVF